MDLVLFRKIKIGGFACIPYSGVGCHIEALGNYSYNSEELVNVLGRIDGITVAAALKYLLGIIL